MNYEALPGMEEALRQIQEKHGKKDDKKSKPKRWWDDDGDGIGYEKGEVKKEEVEQIDEISADLALSASKAADKKRGQLAAAGDKEGAAAKAGQAARLYKAQADRRLGKVAPGKANEELELEEGKNKEGKEQGADGKACWKGYKYAGTENGKDKCVPANEELQAMEDSLMESGLFTEDEVRYIIGEKSEELEEATAMAKRGLDEPEIRQKIAKSTGGGAAADRATKLEKQPTYGNSNKAQQRQNLARAQRSDFRNTTSSSPGLHGYAHKSNDPAVKAKQAARGAQRGALTPQEKKDLGR